MVFNGVLVKELVGKEELSPIPSKYETNNGSGLLTDNITDLLS